MTNNTLFCGIALVVIGLYSYFVHSPEWLARANPIIEKQNEEAKAAFEEAKKTDPNAAEPKLKEPKKQSATALIPSALGAILLVVVGVVVYKPHLRKHAMHAAAVVGAVGVIGGLYALSGGFKELSELGLPSDFGTLWSQPKFRSGAITAIIGAIYVGFAVKSFIDARKAREAGQPAA